MKSHTSVQRLILSERADFDLRLRNFFLLVWWLLSLFSDAWNTCEPEVQLGVQKRARSCQGGRRLRQNNIVQHARQKSIKGFATEVLEISFCLSMLQHLTQLLQLVPVHRWSQCASAQKA